MPFLLGQAALLAAAAGDGVSSVGGATSPSCPIVPSKQPEEGDGASGAQGGH